MIRLAGCILLVGLSLALGPSRAEAQSLDRLFEALARGGGWVTIPIEEGEGSYRTSPLPVGKARVGGCVQVWSGHSGLWDIRAAEPRAGRVLHVTVRPGEPVRFQHETDGWARLELDVNWDQPRDTTLFLWVGMDRPDESSSHEEESDACEPRR